MTNNPNKKLTVGVVFGSRSVEHDVSVVTAQQVMQAMNPSRYEVVPIYITREGKWLTGPGLMDIRNFQNENIEELIGVRETLISPSTQHKGTITPPVAGYMARNTLKKLDVVFPVVHGTHGEDGTLQGLFELADMAYVGCGVMASAVANDKIATKALLRENGVPTLDYTILRREEWSTKRDEVLSRIEEQFKYPLFIKPATLGSSIGIGRPSNRREAIPAIEVALGFDRRVMIESALEGSIEVNCAVIGNTNLRASVLEQPISFQEFLTYDDKYLHSGAAKGMKGAERKIPAPLPDALTEHIRNLTVTAFKAIDGRGTARMDFLVKNGEAYLNEINTMPGSLAFYLWQAEGMSASAVVDELIRLALEAYAEKRKTIYNYRSRLIEQASARGLKGMKGFKK